MATENANPGQHWLGIVNDPSRHEELIHYINEGIVTAEQLSVIRNVIEEMEDAERKEQILKRIDKNQAA